MKMKYNLENNGKHMVGFGSYKDLVDDIEEMRHKTLKNRANQDQFETFTKNGDRYHIEFSGGKWEDVMNVKNMDDFKKALSDFQKNRLEEKIIAKLDYSPKRKRKMSEHDGDYDIDKRWEITPFHSSKMERLPISVIDMNVDMTISAGMDAESINKYGTMVWSVIQLIETFGVQVNVNIIMEVNNLSTCGKSAKMVLNVKRAGQYVSPISLATCFTSVFYRRAMFTADLLVCEAFNVQACSSLGQCKYPSEKKNIWFDKGAIYTRPGAMFKATEIEECLIKMIGVKK